MKSAIQKTAVTGNAVSSFRGRGLEFDSVREYIPGDDIRSIDWRVTARVGSAHVKVFREDRERPMYLCIDVNASMRFGTRNTFKSVQAARVSAFLGWQGINKRDPVTAYLYGDVEGGICQFPAKRTPKSFCRVLKTLSEEVTCQKSVLLEEVLANLESVEKGALIFVISDFMELGNLNETRLARISKRAEVVFIAVNDPADQELPPVGRLWLSKERERLFVDTNNEAANYKEQWIENRKKLREYTMKAKIKTIHLTTESNIRRDLCWKN
jgi:uncharacterized protein (DUF58 family)